MASILFVPRFEGLGWLMMRQSDCVAVTRHQRVRLLSGRNRNRRRELHFLYFGTRLSELSGRKRQFNWKKVAEASDFFSHWHTGCLIDNES